ncbi:MAG: hypothetical protein DRN71_01890 [Candidatus Nanohalarchaeota archaeon]|nr:MAG: hypothetical protein DRN71_01890 [Candidatus Nanohaloarchaeota archaeon]
MGIIAILCALVEYPTMKRLLSRGKSLKAIGGWIYLLLVATLLTVASYAFSGLEAYYCLQWIALCLFGMLLIKALFDISSRYEVKKRENGVL